MLNTFSKQLLSNRKESIVDCICSYSRYVCWVYSEAAMKSSFWVQYYKLICVTSCYVVTCVFFWKRMSESYYFFSFLSFSEEIITISWTALRKWNFSFSSTLLCKSENAQLKRRFCFVRHLYMVFSKSNISNWLTMTFFREF